MTIAVVIILCVFVMTFFGGSYYAYKKCKFGLNALLPDKLKNKACPSSASGFVGTFARAPGMAHCHAWGGNQNRVSTFNRCTWV